GAISRVGHVAADAGGLADGDGVAVEADPIDREGGVAEPEAEREEGRGRRLVPQVAAPGGGLVVVEGREMAHGAREGDGELATRAGVAEEEPGHGAPGLLPQVPALED